MKNRSAVGMKFIILLGISCLLKCFLPLTESHAFSPDKYESDDDYLQANVLVLDGQEQAHSFHDVGDEDWVKFDGQEGNWYYIRTGKPGPRCNTVMELYAADGRPIDDIGFTATFWTGYGESENIQWQCLSDGIYYLRIRQFDSQVFGAGTSYGLAIGNGEAPFPGKLKGKISDATCGKSIQGATVVVSSAGEGSTSCVSNKNGGYTLIKTGGVYDLTASAPGYEVYSAQVEIPELGLTTMNLPMIPLPVPPADLTITAVSKPASARRGDTIPISNAVTNKGQGPAGPFEIGLYLSRDAQIRFGEDHYLGSRHVSRLAAGKSACRRTPVTIPADVQPGIYHVGVLADPAQAVNEDVRDNNAMISKGIIVIE
jgi:hypothetical protein